ncbi:hypothetical protein B0H11DRAFT_2292377 [Mycena galericulata]|nr:hypothetical protein B0H11DRAFT_2292377 [Mycena galericulata]
MDRLKPRHVTDAEARRETSAGFRPSGESNSSASGKQTSSKSRNSNAQPSTQTVMVGSIQVLVSGVDEKHEMRDTRCPIGPALEDLRVHGLMVTKDPDGKPLQFNREWRPIRAAQWLSDMLPKPNVLDFLAEKYGESQKSHWLLVGKAKQQLYAMKSRPGAGEDFDDAKGTATHRNYKDWAIRIVTCHKIPSSIYKDGWNVAIERLRAGEDLPSESEVEEEPKKPRKPVKSKAKSRVRQPRSVSEIEAESESDDSESADSDSFEELVDPKVKTEPGDASDALKGRRRSSRLSQVPEKKSGPLFGPYSDIEEISGLDFGESPLSFVRAWHSVLSRRIRFTQANGASPSFDFDVPDLEGGKRMRSASRESRHSKLITAAPLYKAPDLRLIGTVLLSDNESEQYAPSPRLGPAVATSSFSFEPAAQDASAGPSDSPFLPSIFGSSIPSSSAAASGSPSAFSLPSTSAIPSSSSLAGPPSFSAGVSSFTARGGAVRPASSVVRVGSGLKARAWVGSEHCHPGSGRAWVAAKKGDVSIECLQI